jgi:hypothetical protein
MGRGREACAVKPRFGLAVRRSMPLVVMTTLRKSLVRAGVGLEALVVVGTARRRLAAMDASSL